jgi:HTH-type transcriptional regulator, sugar sensing transcriptional regulator
MKEHILEEIGLTKGESKVYLTLLEVGETTTGKIIEEAQISAGKVYQILDKLIKKGLVSYIVKDKTKYFSASHPNRILDLLSEKENEIKRKEEEIKQILPSLIKSYEFDKKTNETTLFKGLKGIQTAIFELLENSSREIYAMGITTSKDERFNILWEKWHKEREKRKIMCKCLFSEINKEYSEKMQSMKFAEVKLIKGITPSAITISKDYVLIQTYEDDIECLLIKNKNIAESFKTFFETMWNSAIKI